MPPTPDLHPVHDRLLSRSAKEMLLGQRACCVWLTGLSGSGKSTLAIALERSLHAQGRLAMVLDGDNLRTGLNQGLGFSDSERTENVRRAAEVAKLFVRNGTIVICAFVSPTRAIRELARTIIGAEDMVEVFVDAPLAVCEQRDVKGLYAKARSGAVGTFTGVSAPFEPPPAPQVHLRTAEHGAETSLRELLSALAPRIVLP